MEIYGIDVEIKNKPLLEEDFMPIMCWNNAYLSEAKEPFIVAVTANDGSCVVNRTKVRHTADSWDADCYYVSQLVKTMLWLYGGYKVSIVGSITLFEYLKEEYGPEGSRSFDMDFMETVYQKPFTLEYLASPPKAVESPHFLSRHLDGHRIGLAVGGTDRKVAAVSNGKVVYTEEVLWDPISEADPEYHYRGVMESLLAAAKKLPRVDAIGISSAGVHVNNQIRVASLFRNVSPEDFEEKARTIYTRATRSLRCNQVMVMNDGDVAALAGAMSLESNNVLGLAMGNSLAGGFLDPQGSIKGWLNELAFVPVDVNPEASEDEWSGDIGCGGNYFSQAAAIRLAKMTGIRFDADESLADCMRKIQIKAEQGESKARLVFSTIGTFLGHTLAYYHSIYQFDYVLLLGRVTSGSGGDTLFAAAQKVLAEEYPQVANIIAISLPDEDSRRVGQSVAAASLPEC